ncbi:hypothetical protein [Streptacidiphilus melanogenes]|uniref:hypothetical protein n=1 Tax=Streptacidiphilus melanogenes TaxID=411235 RepID=UPI000A9ACE6D|nr:hypothetical protein [Streptacidiphilus melanogenes]
MVWMLLLVIAAIALGIVGAVAKGLVYLLVIGVALFVVAGAVGVLRLRAGGRRPVR